MASNQTFIRAREDIFYPERQAGVKTWPASVIRVPLKSHCAKKIALTLTLTVTACWEPVSP